MQKTNPLLRTAAALTLCALLLSLSGCKLIITRELTELRYNQSRVEAMAKKYMEEKYRVVPEFDEITRHYGHSGEMAAYFYGYIFHSSDGFYVRAAVDLKDGVSFSDTYQYEEIQEALRTLVQQQGVFPEFLLFLPAQDIEEDYLRWGGLYNVAFQKFFDGNLKGFFDPRHEIQLYLPVQQDLSFADFRQRLDDLSGYLGATVNGISFRDGFYSTLREKLAAGDNDVLSYLTGQGAPEAHDNQGIVHYVYTNEALCIHNMQALDPGLYVGLAPSLYNDWSQELEDCLEQFSVDDLIVDRSDPSENACFMERGYRTISQGYRIQYNGEKLEDPWLTIGVDIQALAGEDFSPADLLVGTVELSDGVISHHWANAYEYKEEDRLSPESIHNTYSAFSFYGEDGWAYFTLPAAEPESAYQTGFFLMVKDADTTDTGEAG